MSRRRRVNRRPRVTLASRLFAPEPAAASFRLLAAVRGLVDAGADVTVLTSRPPSLRGSSTPGSIRVSRWPVLRDRDGAVRGYLPYASFDVPLLFRLLVRSQDAVLVEPPPTTGSAARVALALSRTPYVYYAADVVSAAAAGAGYSGLVVRLARFLEGFAVRGAAGVLAVNDDVAEEIHALGVPTGRIHVVSNGVDTSVFTPEGPVHPAIRAHAGPVYVYAGSMNEVHGAEIFVEGFRTVLEQHPDAHLVMVGRGSEVDRVRAATAALPASSYTLLDAVPGEEASAMLRGATAGLASVKPDSGYAFALATKAAAAAASGALVIFAGEGHTAEFVDRGQLGWAVPWETEAVGAAMRAAAVMRADRESERRRRALWVRENASLASVGREVSHHVLRLAAR